MWIYEQSTGRLSRNGVHVGTGYSGKGDGKNNPAMQHVRNVGPIPQGQWIISTPFDHPKKGPHAMRLTPKRGTDALSRSGFLIHGDSIKAPGSASEGCIILSREAREAISKSGDTDLKVIA